MRTGAGRDGSAGRLRRVGSGSRPANPGRRALAAALALGFAAGQAAAAPARPSAASAPPVILGGELYNSTASSRAALAALWPRLQALHLNTVLAPAEWDQVEPEEGRYDFAAVDALLAGARQHGMHVGLLWFGAFKNGRSTYAPRWVRADLRRFPRVETARPLRPTGAVATSRPPVLSAFSPELQAADARAFAALMKHVRDVDRDGRVVLVQVENEVGLLGDSRDRGPLAQAAWRADVPAALLERLRAPDADATPLRAAWEARGRPGRGAWADLFGERPVADEAFMAWSFARYVDGVARAGRPFTTAPLYANAWLGPQPSETEPGEYPSGGPTAGMIDVWKAGAPTLAFVSPDVYVEDARGAQAPYDRPDNRLFIPELRPRAGDLAWALGAHRALGVSVYGIDELKPDSQTAQLFAALAAMADVVARAQAEGRIAAVLVEGEETQVVELGGLALTVRAAEGFRRRQALDAGQTAPAAPPAGPSETDGYDSPPDRRAFGLMIAEGPGRYLFVGRGFLVDAAAGGRPVEYDRVEEGAYADGRWVPGRLLNGDDYGQVVPRDRVGATRVSFLPPAGGR